jgi:uncharacterized membrane protein
MLAELLVLRLIHVLGGIFWVGSGLFTSFFLVPALAASGPSAGQVMGELQRRRLFTILPAVALLTILSGARLMWITSAGLSDAYLASTMGRTFVGSALAALLAFAVGMLVVRPSGARAAGIGASLAAAPEHERAARVAEMNALRRRSAVWGAVALSLLLVAAAGMAIARYLR